MENLRNFENLVSPSSERVGESSAAIEVLEFVFLIDWRRFQSDWKAFPPRRMIFRPKIRLDQPGRGGKNVANVAKCGSGPPFLK